MPLYVSLYKCNAVGVEKQDKTYDSLIISIWGVRN